MFANIRSFTQLFTAEEAAQISANGLFTNSPIDSNDSPPMNNQQSCTLMASLHDPADYGCQKTDGSFTASLPPVTVSY
eukprot:CAMPEP_0179443450 /NCGR_PEP_ID=MMETSP0799-20121207/26881_1 /TAXON_ID=46947 /ORGANISM="Geminigera cryophila, Strain CCMP2564" /LENGTH=77 /DNA_ID=CAMNT_0021229475 /DNA_START=29 /DNA_END=262 /DNA_ORIENTATION=+